MDKQPAMKRSDGLCALFASRREADLAIECPSSEHLAQLAA